MKTQVQQTIVKDGISFGCVLAIVISWTINKSIFWAMVHGFFSWFYVFYYLFFLK